MSRASRLCRAHRRLNRMLQARVKGVQRAGRWELASGAPLRHVFGECGLAVGFDPAWLSAYN
jgi:hypothetical protein